MKQTNQHLRRFRAEHELSLDGFAKEVGVSRVTAWRWEERGRVPPRRYWPRLAKLTGLPASKLFNLEAAE